MAGKPPPANEDLTRDYLRAVGDDWSTLRFGDAKIPLLDVFVAPQAIPSPPPKPLEARSDLVPIPERLADAGFQVHGPAKGRKKGAVELASQAPQPVNAPPLPPVPLSAALTAAQHLILLGEPGAGKTTALQFIGLCVARSKAKSRLELDEDRLPIQLDLRLYADLLSRQAAASLESALAVEINKYLRRPDEQEARDLFHAWLEKGRLLILLDGLDELNTQRTAVQEEILHFAASTSGKETRIVVASRIAGYSALGATFQEYTIKPVQGPVEARNYLRAWLAALQPTWEAAQVAEKTGALMQQISDNLSLQRLMNNPLLLQLAVEDYARTGEIAGSRASLYNSAVEAAWQRALMRGATPDQKKQALEALETLTWSLQSGDLKVAPGDPSLLREKTGLAIRLGERWAFSHTTFQEYFVALRLRRAWERDREAAWAYLQPRLHLPAWREPLLLLAGTLVREAASTLIKRTLRARSPFELLLRRDLALAAAMNAESQALDEDLSRRIQRRARWLLSPRTVKLWQWLDENLFYVVWMGLGILLVRTIPWPQWIPWWVALLVLLALFAAFDIFVFGEPYGVWRHLIRSVKRRMAWVLARVEARTYAVQALQVLDPDEMSPLLIQATRDADSRVRSTAVEVLGRSMNAQALPHLILALQDQDWRVSRAAFGAILDLGLRIGLKQSLPYLAQAIEDEKVGTQVSRLVYVLFLQAYPDLLQEFLEAGDKGRSGVEEALGEDAVPEAVPSLAHALQETDQRMQSPSAMMPKSQPSKDVSSATQVEPAIPQLIRNLQDEETLVRVYAARALGKLGAAEALPHLVKSIEDESGMVKGEAMQALAATLSSLDLPGDRKSRRAENRLLRRAARALQLTLDFPEELGLFFAPEIGIPTALSVVAERQAKLSLAATPYRDPLLPRPVSPGKKAFNHALRGLGWARWSQCCSERRRMFWEIVGKRQSNPGQRQIRAGRWPYWWPA